MAIFSNAQTFIISFLAMMAGADELSAQTQTDAAARITEALARLGPINVTTHHEEEYEYEECTESGRAREAGSGITCRKRKGKRLTPKTEQTILKPGPLTLSFPHPPEFGSTRYTDFPDDLIESANEFYNCTAGRGNYNLNLVLNVSRSQSVAISRSIMNTLGGSFTAQVKPFGVGGSASINISQTSVTSSSRMDGDQSSYTITNSGSVSVDPQTAIIASLRSYRIQANIPFTMRGVVDAEVSPNDRGIKRASDVLGEKERTFVVGGDIITTDNAKGRVDIFEIKDGCKEKSGSTQAPFSQSTNQRLFVAPIDIYKLQVNTQGGYDRASRRRSRR